VMGRLFAGIFLACCSGLASGNQIDPLSVLPHKKLSAQFRVETLRTSSEFLGSLKDDSVNISSNTVTFTSKGEILKDGTSLVIVEQREEDGSMLQIEAFLDSRFLRINPTADAKGLSGTISSFNSGGSLSEILGFRVDGESLGGTGITLSEILTAAKVVSKRGRTTVYELPGRSSNPKQKPNRIEVELSEDSKNLVRVKTVGYDLAEPALTVESKFDKFIEIDGFKTPTAATLTSSQRVMMKPGGPYIEVDKWVKKVTLSSIKADSDLTPYLPKKGAKFLESGYDTSKRNYFDWDGSRFVKSSVTNPSKEDPYPGAIWLFVPALAALGVGGWLLIKKKPGRLSNH
jgi:hypothetical protein